MSHIILMPAWFSGYDISLEFIFFIVSLTVAITAYDVYKLTGQRQPKLFSLAFLLISLSYVIRAVVNIFILSELAEQPTLLSELRDAIVLNNLGIYINLLFFISGLLVLVYLSLKSHSKKLFALLFLTTLLGITFSANRIALFYLLSTLFLVYIVNHYWINYRKRKTKRTLFILVAFTSLLLSTLFFIFSTENEVFYILGHIFELMAYAIILYNLIYLKNESKKKSA